MGKARPVRAAIYARISQDRYSDDPARAGAGVDRQLKDCEKLCAARGWTVVGEYRDDSISAFSGRRRPRYADLLADIEAGAVDAVVVWHLDRLHRRPVELEHFMELTERHSVKLATCTGDVDLGTDSGRLHARIMGAVARAESERKAVRVARAARQIAEKGGRCGRSRTFGHDGGRIVAAEANVIREAARRLLAGESLASVTRSLVERGVQTINGNPFTPGRLRLLMVSARISGRREHTPVDDYRGKGRSRPLIGEITTEATDFPAIITPDDSDRLRAMLTDPARRTNGGRGRPHTTLLSGILVCAHCDQPMYSRPKHRQPYYQCVPMPGRGCGRLAIAGHRIDTAIAEDVIAALATPDFLDRLRAHHGGDDDAIDRIKRGERKLEELAAAWGADDISRTEWKSAKAVVDRQLAADRAVLARTDAVRALDVFAGCRSRDDYAERWEALNTSQQRAAVTSVVHRIIVKPAELRGARRWDPDRYEIAWRDATPVTRRRGHAHPTHPSAPARGRGRSISPR